MARARARTETEPREGLSLAEVRQELLAALGEHHHREPRQRRRWAAWEERRLALLEAYGTLRRLALLEACSRLCREGRLAGGEALGLLGFLLEADPERGLEARGAARAGCGLAPLAWRGEWLALAGARAPWGGA